MFSYIAMCVLYASYVLTADIIKANGRDALVSKVAATLFIPYDIFCNIFIVSFWGLDIPTQLTVTARMKDWREPDYLSLSWLGKNRKLFAIWLCDTKLDRDDPFTGDHC